MAPTAPLARLEVICGPMFAGKSTLLLNRLRSVGRPFVLFKPVLDTRYADDRVVTHDGDSEQAVSIAGAQQIVPRADGLDLLGIDEAHFFGAGLIAPVITLLARRCTIVVAGCDRDHRGEPFEPFPRLLCEADFVTKLCGPCAVCGRPAVHSQRMIQVSGPIVVGGAEAYQARCRACFQPGS